MKKVENARPQKHKIVGNDHMLAWLGK